MPDADNNPSKPCLQHLQGEPLQTTIPPAPASCARTPRADTGTRAPRQHLETGRKPIRASATPDKGAARVYQNTNFLPGAAAGETPKCPARFSAPNTLGGLLAHHSR
ncbi:hypothetical protein CCUS01_17230 [Colletotrichum cuscutae]|uniref:Uncharacterized protein n=1 Tax=Colletotrichum cuscutae TaxID=1209917 RepID=A0AAI9V6K1_9PEZI|nr:hypothetical protein CCUS01_17230 [Colletotrichum cuscutae]